MKSKPQIRREIDIARACFAAGLDRAVENYDAAVSDAVETHLPKKADDTRKWFRETYEKFLKRYGSRPAKGKPFVSLDVKHVRAYVAAHRGFILDAHARPDDLAEYVTACQGDPAPKKSQPALASG